MSIMGSDSTHEPDELYSINDGRFSYGPIRGLRFNNTSRMPPADLQRLFKTTRSRGYKLTKKDIEAQCRLYGVYRAELRNMPIRELRDVFAKLVKEGKLNASTTEAVQLEAALREKFNVLNKAHIASVSRARQARFDAITDPAEAAAYSVPRFLQRYFLNADGTPNQTRTPDPIALPARLIDCEGLYSAAEDIPGLHLCRDEAYHALAVGWDHSAVHHAVEKAAPAAYEKAIKASEERAKMRKGWLWMGEAERDEDEEVVEEDPRVVRMNEHLKFLETLKDNEKRAAEMADKEFHISHVTGRYLVECPEIEEGWSCGALYMTIVLDEENKGRVVAEFDFGILEGIMRLRQVDEEPLPHGDDVDSEGEDYCYDDDVDDDDDDGAYGYSFNPSTSRKRKRSTAQSQPKHLQPQAKKLKPRPPPTSTEKLKLLFQWRGRETGEGEIQLGPDQGYIEFEDPDCTTFTGLMNSEYFTKAKLRGYQVARSDGKRIKAAWRDFSERAHHRESIRRWSSW